MHNGDHDGPRAKRVSQLWALDDAYVVKWRQSRWNFKQTGWCCLSWWLNRRASAAFAGVPGSIPSLGVCDFSRFCQNFTSDFPFSFPFLSPFDLWLALKTHSLHFPQKKRKTNKATEYWCRLCYVSYLDCKGQTTLGIKPRFHTVSWKSSRQLSWKC